MQVSTLVAIGIAALAPAGSSGQSVTGPPAFEVASIKPASPPPSQLGRGIFTFPGGRIAAYGVNLEKLIEEAFGVQPFQVSGGPRWMHEDRYDIVAKPPDSSISSKSNPPSPKTPPNDEQRQMLQTLLTDRFQLKYHRETQEGSVYLLVKGNKDLKLQDAKSKDAYSWVGGLGGGVISGDGLWGMNISMQLFASRLSAYLEHPVLDQTGLKGSFDFKYEYHSDDTQPDVVASILTSVQGLGLKLEPAKGPVETLVIEHAEKPADN
jgi:uncharacterized protein (TIGR03435 family)